MKRRILTWLLAVLICGGSATVLESCGSMRSYWGVEGNYDFDDHHHHHKPKKHKKHHKKHHKHHHDDDDD